MSTLANRVSQFSRAKETEEARWLKRLAEMVEEAEGFLQFMYDIQAQKG